MTEPWLDDIIAIRNRGDEYVEVTGFGSPPEHVLARSAVEEAVSMARTKYVDGSITIEQLKHALDVIHETPR